MKYIGRNELLLADRQLCDWYGCVVTCEMGNLSDMMIIGAYPSFFQVSISQ